jgi:predicted CxxxxCH...CXXCH cytochrome family protein
MMKNLTLHRLIVLSAAAMLLLGWGCYNNLDPEYEEPEGGLHEFEEPAVAGHQTYFQEHGNDFSECTECHGNRLQGIAYEDGGERIRSCFECHSASNHPADPADVSAVSVHVDYLRDNDFDYTECLDCHAATEDALFGGSCSSTECHSSAYGGPDACNVCHGSFDGVASDPASWAPPQGLEGVLSISDPGIGAHQVHMNVDTDLFAQLSCDNCHRVPARVNDSIHMDGDGKAEVDFGGISGNGTANPQYSSTDNSCSSTYCHGEAAEPVWTVMDGSYDDCGSCHALPPDTPSHVGTSFPADCATCHGDVIDNSGEIIDGTMHVNGRTDLTL